MRYIRIILLLILSMLFVPASSPAKEEAAKPPKEAAAVKKEEAPEVQREPVYAPNENDVKSFVYRWFSWLDHQVADFLFAYHLSKDDLLMKLPEGVLHNEADFKVWYQAQKDKIKSNSYEVGDIKVSFLPKDRFKVDFPVRWKAKTYKGESLDVKFKESWILSLAGSGRFNINRYTVTKAK
jgi:hypothetical protein